MKMSRERLYTLLYNAVGYMYETGMDGYEVLDYLGMTPDELLQIEDGEEFEDEEL